MKRILLSFGAALCAAVPAFSASVIGLDPATDAQGTVDVLASPQVVVQTEGNPAAVYADWWQSDNPNNKVRVFLKGSGNLWQGNMPVNHAGEAHYVLWAETAEGVATNYPEQVYTIEEATGATVTDLNGLNPLRYPDFTTWTKDESDGLVNDYWYAQPSRGITFPSVPQAIRLQPVHGSNPEGGYIRTQEILDENFDVIEEGYAVGSLWFKAHTSESHDGPGTLVVERGYIDWDLWDYVWETVAEIEVPSLSITEWTQFHLIIQAPDKKVLRIRNKTEVASSSVANTGYIDLCDLVMTPLTPLVEVYKDDADYGPAGFPSVQDPVEFHIAVSNVFESAAASNITPRLVWRQKSGLHWDAWNETIMTNLEGRAVQGDGTYACVLSTATKPVGLRAGAFEYFYEVSYAGYTPTFRQLKYPRHPLLNHVVNHRFDYDEIGATYKYLVHTNALAFYTDANGYVNEGRAPAVWPSMKEQFNFFGGVRGEFLEAAYDYNVVPGTPAAASWWGYTHRFDVRNLDEGWPVAEANYILYDDFDASTTVQPSTFQVEGEYFYAKPLASDGIRRFRTANDKMALTIADVDDDSPSGLEKAYDMQLVGDYTWTAIVHVTNAVDAYMAVTSANHHASGETVYRPGPYVWIETEQEDTAINPPTSGLVKPVVYATNYVTSVVRVRDETTGRWVVSTNALGQTNYVSTLVWEPDFGAETGFSEDDFRIPDEKADPAITKAPRIQIDYDGFLMYRLCTTNGQYEVRRAAWQDFNDWAADINYFSRSYGLYDMTVFESDVNDRADSSFGYMTVRSFQDDTPYVDDVFDPVGKSRYADGMVAQNAWFEMDRTLTAANESGTAFAGNKAVRLSTLPVAPGTLETTYYSKSDEGGRGSLTFRARAAARDTIVEYYNDGLSWTEGYCVYALVNVSSMSDHTNASVSVFANWSDDNNYLEARLVQRCRYEASSGSVTADNLEQSLKKYLELEIREKVDGVERLLTTTDRVNTWSGVRPFRFPSPTSSSNDGPNYDLAHADGWVIALAVNGTAVEARLYRGKGQNSAKNGFLAATQADPLRPVGDHWTQDADRRVTATTTLTKTGTVAFNASDAAATFRPYVIPYTAYQALESGRIYPMTVSGASAFNAVFNSSDSAWKRATGLYWDYMDPWERVVQGGTGAAYPSTLSRPAPTTFYRVQVYRTNVEKSTDQVAPVPTYTTDWANDWDEIGNHQSDRIASVTGFGWQNVEIPMKLWDDTFVRIQAQPYRAGMTGMASDRSTGSLVLDDIGGEAWLGKTIWDRDFNNTANLTASWIGTYATIVPDGREEHKWALVRSRANPNKGVQPGAGESLPRAYTNLAQSIVSPLLRDGVGDIIFEYEAADADVAFAVEMINERTGALITGEQVPTVRTAFVGQASTSLYVPALRAGVSGRLRIRTLDADESGLSEAGTLYVDDLRATDYPNTGDTSWEAYNALISSFSTPATDTSVPEISTKTEDKFDLENQNYRSAVLNDRRDHDTPPPDQEWPDHVPYIQTPAIETGVGEVSFWYRLAPGETKPGRIHLLVAKTQSTPDVQWVPLTEYDLNTNLVQNAETGEWYYENPNLEEERLRFAALTNITTKEWTYFSAEFYQQNYNVLRIFAGTNHASFSGGGTGNGRVMIDNVLITEPVRASIDVGRIEFDPAVPLCTGDTGAKVTLVNPRMGPYDIEVHLDWFASRDTILDCAITNTFDVVSTNTSTEVVTWTDENGRVHRETITTYEVLTNALLTINPTRLPATMRWGHGSWGRLASGTLDFTNRPGTLVYDSTSRIPTDRYPADTVFQYCVRIEYKGKFSSPIDSETQGRTKNGFWFENPAWYEPIDLNETFGTTNQPVAHFWNFTVSTNQAFINEFQTSTRYGDDESQFVELIGAEGADISNWTLWHGGFEDDALTYGTTMWTNKLAAGAKFAPDPNATTNKGWGFYVLGNSLVAGANERLFPEGAGEWNVFMYVPGALELRRSMGGSVHKISWGSSEDTKKYEENGFPNIGTHNTRYLVSHAQSIDPDSENFDFAWETSWDPTPGGYNAGEEMLIWDLTGEIANPEHPYIGQPVIRTMVMDETKVSMTFSVCVTNETAPALAANDYTWYLDVGHDPGFAIKDSVPIETEISLPEGGEEETFPCEWPIPSDPAQDHFFFRVRAVPRWAE